MPDDSADLRDDEDPLEPDFAGLDAESDPADEEHPDREDEANLQTDSSATS